MPSSIRPIAGALLACLVAGASGTLPAAGQSRAPHNVILFVPDGLRASMVDATTAPAMNALKSAGVSFSNSHSIFPTFTTANASGMATGHYLGDTGDFSNTIFAGYKVAPAGLSSTPFLENDPVLQDVTRHFNGNYLNEETVLAAARRAGYGTAAVGKLGPVAIFDVTDTSGAGTIVIDDSTGRKDAGGTSVAWPLPDALKAQLRVAVGTDVAPARGDNGVAGTADAPGTKVANLVQQQFFVDAATKVVLPALKARNAPFVMVFWSRDPDGTQHNQGDSLGSLTPGINGPTSLAAIRNADDDLKALRDALRTLGLDSTTDIIIAADHGFSTISKQSQTSAAARYDFTPGVPAKSLPPGFLALDLAKALGLPLSDPDANDITVHPDLDRRFPSRGDGLLGYDVTAPEVVVAANGGSDLIYVPSPNAATLAPKIVAALLAQDYVSGIFVDDRLGKFAGTLPLSAVNMMGSAVTPTPAIAVSFRSFDTGCSLPERCSVEVADTTLQQGQGMHGSFGRGDTANFMAAIGPDFKAGFADPAPVSNADVGMTIARLLRLDIAPHGTLIGRPMTEALRGGALPAFARSELRSEPAAGGLATILRLQTVGATRYFDVAGFPGRTVGL